MLHILLNFQGSVTDVMEFFCKCKIFGIPGEDIVCDNQ